MATLEKIRSKSALLLIIVGAGLLAFIIGDFFTSGRTLFGTGTTIAKVDGNKIDIQEFQRRVQDASQQAQAQNQRMDNAVLQQQVLNAMIAEKLFDQEVKDLGLTVTDQELTDMMVGKNSQYVDRMVQQQLGVPDAKTAHDMAF
ncbi:SurA N-terminal domain-containing protein, partial [uncultured Duncaniella sp.]